MRSLFRAPILYIALSDQFLPSWNNLDELLLKRRPAEIIPLNLTGKHLPPIPIFQDIHQHVPNFEHDLSALGILSAGGIAVQVAKPGKIVGEDLVGEAGLQLLGCPQFFT
jgi:hypothetical protein